jgi:hypothetical protein
MKQQYFDFRLKTTQFQNYISFILNELIELYSPAPLEGLG